MYYLIYLTSRRVARGAVRAQRRLKRAEQAKGVRAAGVKCATVNVVPKIPL